MFKSGQASNGDTNQPDGLVYADLGWNAKPQTAPKPDVVHGADEMTEYAAVDFKKTAARANPALQPPDSESDDEEFIGAK